VSCIHDQMLRNHKVLILDRHTYVTVAPMSLYPRNVISRARHDNGPYSSNLSTSAVGVDSSQPIPRGPSTPHQNKSQEPLRLCEIYIYNPLTSQWSRIWKQTQNDPFLGVHLTLGHPRILKFCAGHIGSGVFVDFLDVSGVNSRYLADKGESEVQVRIWRRGTGPDWPNSGGGTLSTGRTIFQALNRTVGERVRDVGVADMLLVGPGRGLYSHFGGGAIEQGRGQEMGVKQKNQPVPGTFLGTSLNGPTKGIQFRDQPASVDTIRTPRRPANTAIGLHKRFSSPEDPFPGRMVSVAPPWDREFQREQSEQQKLTKFKDPDPSSSTSKLSNLENTTCTETTPLRQANISYRNFRSKCSTCNTVYNSGRVRQAHVNRTKHKLICTQCQPPTEWLQTHAFVAHCLQTGHIDVEQYSNKKRNSGEKEQVRLSEEMAATGPSPGVEEDITGSRMEGVVSHHPVIIKEEPDTEIEWKSADSLLSGGKHGQKSPPPNTPPISFKFFHSKCSTCSKLQTTGSDGNRHADETGHPVVCIICRPPVTFSTLEGLYNHYRQTGHTGARQPMPSPTGEKRNRLKEDATALKEALHIDRRKETSPTAGVEGGSHGPIEGVLKQYSAECKDSNKRASLLGSREDSGTDRDTPPRKKRKRGENEEKKAIEGKQERHKAKARSKEGGKKQSKKRKAVEAPVLSPPNPPATLTSPPLPTLPLVEERREKEHKRQCTAEEEQTPVASLNEKSSHRSRGKAQPDSKHSSSSRSRRQHLRSPSSPPSSASSSSLSSPSSSSSSSPSSSPSSSSSSSSSPSSSSNPPIPSRPHSSILAEDDRRRLQEFAVKKNELALKRHELKIQRNQLKLEEERLKLEIRKRVMAGLAKSVSLAPQSPTSSNNPRPAVAAVDVIAPPAGTPATIKAVPNITCSACGKLGHRKSSKECSLYARKIR